jgi:anti-sigma factor RsiW
MRADTRQSECETLHPYLADAAVGALTGGLARRVEAHLARCEECAGRVSAIGQLGSVLDGLAPEPPPAEIWAGIAPRLRPRQVRWVPRLAWATGLAAAAAVLVLVAPHGPAPVSTKPQPSGAALRSTATYDVVSAVEMSDDSAALGLYARSAGRGAWLSPAASAVYLGSKGKDTGS